MGAANADGDPERSGALGTTSPGPAGQRLVKFVANLKRHPFWVLLSALVALVLVIGQLADSIPSIGRALAGARSLLPEQEPRQDLAYATSTGIYLQVPDADPRLLAQVPDTESVVELEWSADGKQLAALVAHQEADEEYPSLEDRRIWYVDLTKNEEGTWPCPNCGPITFTGRQVLTLSDGDGIQLRVFSLDDLPASPAFSGPNWGAKQRTEDVATVLGGGPDGLLFALPDPEGTSAQGGPELIYRTDADGRTAYLGKTGSYVAVGGGVTRSGGREIAVVYTEHSSACDNVDRVAVINLSNNSRREFPEPDTPEAWRVNSIDWSPEGRLVSVRYALSRAPETCGMTVVVPHVAAWDGKAWQRVPETEGSVVVTAGSSDALATLGDAPDSQALQLKARYAGEDAWTHIADNAEKVEWRPLSS